MEDIGPLSKVNGNLDEVEIEIQNVQHGEEESSPKMQQIHLITREGSGRSPFNPIDVGLYEMMQSHPRIIETVIRKTSIPTNTHTQSSTDSAYTTIKSTPTIPPYIQGAHGIRSKF